MKQQVKISACATFSLDRLYWQWIHVMWRLIQRIVCIIWTTISVNRCLHWWEWLELVAFYMLESLHCFYDIKWPAYSNNCRTYMILVLPSLLEKFRIYTYEIPFVVKCVSLMSFLTEANDTCEWIWKPYALISTNVVVTLPIISLLSVIFCWIIKNSPNVDNFYHPVTMM